MEDQPEYLKRHEAEIRSIVLTDEHKPKKVSHSAGFVQPSQEYFVMLELRRRWMIANFDQNTGKELEVFLSFDEWIRD
jgi:hypothetical protein